MLSPWMCGSLLHKKHRQLTQEECPASLGEEPPCLIPMGSQSNAFLPGCVLMRQQW